MFPDPGCTTVWAKARLVRYGFSGKRLLMRSTPAPLGPFLKILIQSPRPPNLTEREEQADGKE